MKIVFAAALMVAAAPVIAQDTAAPAPTAATKLSVDAPIEALVADPAAKAVLEANFPGISAHPMYDSFKAMSLKQVQPMSNGVVTDEKIAKTAEGLAAIK